MNENVNEWAGSKGNFEGKESESQAQSLKVRGHRGFRLEMRLTH